MNLFLRWAIGAAALYATVWFGHSFGLHIGFSGHGVQSVVAAFIAVLALTLVNALIRPIVKLLTLPLSCLTFGLFGFVVNALMFWLVGQLEIGLQVHDLVAALYGSLVTSALFGILNMFVVEGKSDR